MPPPRSRNTDLDLPRGLYRHRTRFRARAYGDDLHAVKIGDEKPKWRYFDPPLSEAAKAFYQWKGDTDSGGEVSKLLRNYLKSKSFLRLAAKTQKSEEKRVDRLERVFGHRSAQGLKPEHFVGYLETQPPQGGKKDLKRMSVIMTLWEASGLIERNFIPAVLKAFAPPDNKRDRYVTDAELKKALEVCEKNDFYRAKIVQSFLELEHLIGRRVSNTRTIKRSDLTKEGIVVDETKTGKKVVIPWTPELKKTVKRISARLKPGFYLLTNREGNLLSEGSLNQAFQTMRKHFQEAGIADFQPRDLRAKYGTDMEDSGRDGAKNVNNSKKVFDMHYQRKPKKVESLK